MKIDVMIKSPKRMKSPGGFPPRFAAVARAFANSNLIVLGVLYSSAVHGDALDSSLKVRFNFDAAPLGDVIVDTSPAAAHFGANRDATWMASEAWRFGTSYTHQTRIEPMISIVYG